MSVILLIIFCLIDVLHCEDRQSRLVHLSQGPVRGYKDANGGFYAFYGIPYATTPLGRDRYKAALPAPEWSEVLEAVDEKIICPQKDLMGYTSRRNLVIKDDCLIANVFVPDVADRKLPVVVYVHGGVYLFGYSNLLTHKSLVRSHKVVVVSFNYRLGVTGFLCLGTKNIPGNAGMKDQVVLLRWVKKNIKSFGGNPDDITLAGYSAGSSAADLLMLSPLTDGLFSKLILESGVSFSSHGLQMDPIRYAREYARLLNNTTTEDFDALEEFYLSSSEEFLNSELTILREDTAAIMCPCVERQVSGEEAFLSEHPIAILKRGAKKLPTLIGYADKEGMWRLPVFEEWSVKMNENLSQFLPSDLHFKNEEERNMVLDEIRQFYFGGSPITRSNIMGYIDFFTDTLFMYYTLQSVSIQVNAGNEDIYLYAYSFVYPNEQIIPYVNIRAPTHCMQSYAVADGNYTYTEDEGITPEHKEIKKFLRGLWYNFIKTGKPIPDGSHLPKWPPVGKSLSPHMVLDEPLQLKKHLMKERYEFWKGIYDKYYLEAIPPTITQGQKTEL
ncbi:unnamed protein product [Leptosia nina]|uniref:Carboxylic ester hydrolase n=1 Tax=Leptosia nina TaxID=320188 RepID=A0AAV1JI28_9NEOP